MIHRFCMAALICLVASSSWGGDEGAAKKGAQEEAASRDQAQLEKEFAEKLTGATLLGSFTLDSETQQDLQPKPEKYRIQSVSKIKDETWLFLAGVEYGGKKEIVVPMTLTVKWAGDTPMITLTDLNIPLLGVYSARVLFYGDRYAGVWSGADHGGELFGRITKPSKENSDADKKGQQPEKPASEK